ncbi:MAG: VPLPA-CTERM sorting domain-containing protein [Methylococcaceae bacterium]
MKQFTKTLLAGAIALAATGVAEAKIAPTVDPLQYTGSEAVLTIWNTTLEKSFSLDLGMQQSAFLADTNLTRNWSLSDANLTSFLAGNGVSDNIIYSIVSGSSSLSTSTSSFVSGGIYNSLTKKAASLTDYGLVTTSSNTLAEFSAVQTSSTQINNANTAVANNNLNLNTAANEVSGLIATNASVYATLADTGYAGTAFGTNLNGVLNSVNIFADQSSALNVFRASLNPALTTQTAYAQFNGQYHLNLAASTLSYSVAAVPLPAAVWMFGAGLMGVLRLTRRKSMAV